MSQITPTPGRVIWYTPGENDGITRNGAEPLAAIVAAVLADGTLVPRGQRGAVLHDSAEIADRVLAMVRDRRVTAIDGTSIPIEAESVCVHGDTPGAVEIAHAVRDRLRTAGVGLAPFIN